MCTLSLTHSLLAACISPSSITIGKYPRPRRLTELTVLEAEKCKQPVTSPGCVACDGWYHDSCMRGRDHTWWDKKPELWCRVEEPGDRSVWTLLFYNSLPGRAKPAVMSTLTPVRPALLRISYLALSSASEPLVFDTIFQCSHFGDQVPTH